MVAGYPGRLSTEMTTIEDLVPQSGWIEAQVTDGSPTIRRIAFVTSGGDHLSSQGFQVWIQSGTARAYINSTPQGSAHTFISPTSLCRVRLRRQMPAGTVTFDTSADGGVTWTTRYTFAATWTLSTGAFIYTPSTTVAIVGAALQGYTPSLI
jgi:hypothetical protein